MPHHDSSTSCLDFLSLRNMVASPCSISISTFTVQQSQPAVFHLRISVSASQSLHMNSQSSLRLAYLVTASSLLLLHFGPGYPPKSSLFSVIYTLLSGSFVATFYTCISLFIYFHFPCAHVYICIYVCIQVQVCRLCLFIFSFR